MRELVRDDIVVNNLLGQDATVVYRLRTFKTGPDEYEQQFGGFPDWVQYHGYDLLPMDDNLVVRMTGLQRAHLRGHLPHEVEERLGKVDARELAKLRDLRDFLNTRDLGDKT